MTILGLGLSMVVLLGACISYSGAETDRDRLTYESFEARQEKVVLQETGQDGEALHIAYSRRGGSGGGNAVVLLHGVPSSSCMYRYVLDTLRISDATFVVLNTIGAPGGFAPPPSMDNPLVQVAMRLVGFEGEGTIRFIVCNMVAEPEELDTAVQLEGYY